MALFDDHEGTAGRPRRLNRWAQVPPPDGGDALASWAARADQAKAFLRDSLS